MKLKVNVNRWNNDVRFDDVYGTETSHEWGKNLSREGSVKNYVEKIKINT